MSSSAARQKSITDDLMVQNGQFESRNALLDQSLESNFNTLQPSTDTKLDPNASVENVQA